MKKSLLASFALSLLIFGCGKQSEPTGQKKLKIAVIPKGESHIFWKTCQAGAMKAAKELSDVEVIWKGPDKEDDRNSQVQTVQNFTVKHVDAIALAPVDGDVLTKSVESAVKAGIKVVIFDSALKRHDSIESFVATDNFHGGELCGKALAESLGGKGKVIMLRMLEGSASTTAREEGFLKGIQEAAPEIELISTSEYGGSSVGSAQKKAQLLISKYSTVVEGIFCCNETTTEGMLLTLKQMGLAGKVKFVGFDANQSLISGLEDGSIYALAVQNPMRMGYLSVKAAYAALTNKPVEKRIDTGVAMVNLQNLKSPEIQSIVFPKAD
jgi:ribose transport system substrate-binding protein